MADSAGTTAWGKILQIVLIIIAAVIGGAISDGFAGVVGGAALGFLFADFATLRKRLAAIEQQLAELSPSRVATTSKSLETPRASPEIPIVEQATEPATANLDVPSRPIVPETPRQMDISATPATASSAVPEPALSQSWRKSQLRTPLEDRLIGAVKNYFTTGNVLVRVGIIVLFFGVAFLLKYAAEHTNLPIEIRLAGVAAGGIALLLLGWRLRLSKPTYGLLLQGAGIGVLYLTIFAAARLYPVLPMSAAFMLLAAIGVFAAILAVKQDARSLAVMGITGGFLAPILVSTGQGSHVGLFSYYAILDAGILAIAWHKAWRPLNLLGFAFTFVIAVYWGFMSYRPEFFTTTEPFLILFFLFFVAIAVLYATRLAPKLTSYVDGTLVFGTPIVAFGLQSALVKHYEYGMAFSALVVSLFYLSLAMILYRRKQETLRLLVEAFLALGVVFGTLAIPLALDGHWTAATWALEGAAMLWVGARQSRWLARAFGLLLEFAAGMAFLNHWDVAANALPIFNSGFVGALMISVAGLFSAWYLSKRLNDPCDHEKFAEVLLFPWGVAWWLAAGLVEINRIVPEHQQLHVALLFVTATAIGFSLLQRKLDWPIARLPALGLLAALVLFALAELDRRTHPLSGLGIAAWPIAFVAYYWILKRHETHSSIIGYLHSATLWLLTALTTWEVAWQIDRLVAGSGTWPMIAWLIVPALTLLFIATRGATLKWPVQHYWRYYGLIGAAPIAIFIALWSLATNLLSDGNPAPLPYLPLLNPLDIAQGFAFLVLIRWLLKVRSEHFPLWEDVSRRTTIGAISALGFVWVNAILVRTLHYWSGIPFDFDSMWHSTLAQAAFSLFWSVLALCIMPYASRKGLRILWLVGAALLGLVVLKLFTIDISDVGGLMRIVSFIGVALLLLAIGYFSPVPPKHKDVTS